MNPMGGFARRMSYWNAFAARYPGIPAFRIDGGSIFASATAEAPVLNRWMLEGTWRSKLDALNLSVQDAPVWREMADLAAASQIPAEWLRVPLVSSNVKARRSGYPNIRRYVVRSVPVGRGGVLRVGITGILVDRGDRLDRKEFELQDAAAAAREVFAEMRGQTDYRVLLADADLGRAISVAVAVPGYNILVVAHNYAVLNDPQLVGETLLVVPINEGRMISEVRIALDEAASQVQVESRFVPLDQTIPDDPGMGDFVRRAQSEVDAFKARLGIR